MKNLIRLEELFFVLLAIYLFSLLDFSWWWFVILFLAPDLGMIGYVANPRLGAITYNLIHHEAVAVGFYLVGAMAGLQLFQLIGLIILAHSSLDRMMGYGLKFLDSFEHTHLGLIGRSAKNKRSFQKESDSPNQDDNLTL